MALAAADVAARLSVVRERIARAGGAPEQVTVVAVTKGHGADAARTALAAGLVDVGENYAADLLATRAATVGEEVTCRWHFLGHVQRNKVRAIAAAVDIWQAVDRLAAGTEISRRAPGAEVLVQVNVSGEAQRNGCDPDEARALVDDLVGLGLDVRGLMAVGPAPPQDARPAFRLLAALADRLGLPVRSMGMSDDLEAAVSEGSTMVRVGRALFGPRDGGDDLRR